jgi:hypothetical protein
MYFGIYSKSCVRERGHPLDGCVGDLGPGKIPEFVTLILDTSMKGTQVETRPMSAGTQADRAASK